MSEPSSNTNNPSPESEQPAVVPPAPPAVAVAKPKGKIRRALSWSFSPFVNVTGWLGLRNITSGIDGIKTMGRDFFVPQAAEHAETFEEAAHRLGLNRQALARKEREFMRLACIFVTFSVAILFYAVYLAWTGMVFAFILAFIVSCLALVYAFRFHFWWFQVKHRKLGCTLQEWYGSQAIAPPTPTRKRKKKGGNPS